MEIFVVDGKAFTDKNAASVAWLNARVNPRVEWGGEDEGDAPFEGIELDASSLEEEEDKLISFTSQWGEQKYERGLFLDWPWR